MAELLDVETDTLRPAPAIITTIRLPENWRAVTVTCVRPEAPESPLATECDHGILRIQTPPFETALIVYIRPATD
jgi:hypothetical protein